jgi:hypothetical protein
LNNPPQNTEKREYYTGVGWKRGLGREHRKKYSAKYSLKIWY